MLPLIDFFTMPSSVFLMPRHAIFHVCRLRVAAPYPAIDADFRHAAAMLLLLAANINAATGMIFFAERYYYQTHAARLL